MFTERWKGAIGKGKNNWKEQFEIWGARGGQQIITWKNKIIGRKEWISLDKSFHTWG